MYLVPTKHELNVDFDGTKHPSLLTSVVLQYAQYYIRREQRSELLQECSPLTCNSTYILVVR